MFSRKPFQLASPLFIRNFLLIFLCANLPACQSDGQTDYDESDYFQRRKIPEYIMESLPINTDTLGQSSFFTFMGHGKIDSEILKKLTQRGDELSVLFQKLYSQNKIPHKIKWHLYPSSETKGLMLKNSSPIHFDFEKMEVHSVANSIFGNHYSGQIMQLFFRQIFGKAVRHELEMGLAILNDSKWQGVGYRRWAARLAAAKAMPSLSELFDSERQRKCSPLIFGTATACLVDFLIEKNGEKIFIEKYTDWTPTADEINGLEYDWEKYLVRISDEYKFFEKNNPQLPYLKGFNFAHEGYRIFNGYGSRKAEQSLRHLTNMGSNSIAIVPYTFMEFPNKPVQIPIVNRAGMENDESIITSSEHAQALGLSIVLKPQIWMGGGHWPGDIAMQSDEDWSEFFHCYRHWIMHYAMLAEIYEWEALCVGTEMVQTTLNREEDWKKLFSDLRKIYSGQLTYAANWGDEFEKTKIWDELDFIGINCYYPLSEKDEPTNDELADAFEEVIEKIEKIHQQYDKPVVFTEIGFPSIDAPWKEPHNDWGDFTANEIHQRRCYETVFQALENKAWCGGILWWKYPCDLEHPGRGGKEFTPHGKAAEATVEKWFNQYDE